MSFTVLYCTGYLLVMKLLKSKIKIPCRNNLLAGIHISVWLNRPLMCEKLELLELGMRGGFHEPLYRASEWGADTEQPLLSGAAYYCMFCGAGRLPCTQCSQGLAVCISLNLGASSGGFMQSCSLVHHLSLSTLREWQRKCSLLGGQSHVRARAHHHWLGYITGFSWGTDVTTRSPASELCDPSRTSFSAFHSKSDSTQACTSWKLGFSSFYFFISKDLVRLFHLSLWNKASEQVSEWMKQLHYLATYESRCLLCEIIP